MKRRKKTIAWAAGLGLILLIGCGYALWIKSYVIGPRSRTVNLETGPTIQALFIQQLKDDGSATYRSYGGQWVGTDGDTDLHFLPDDSVVMIEYADAVTTYRGSYQISADGVIDAKFPTYHSQWTQMLIGRDAQSLLLLPAEEVGLGHAGEGSWPFRPTKNTAGLKRFIKEQDIEAHLGKLSVGRGDMAKLSVIYDDAHALHGGMTLRVDGTGQLTANAIGQKTGEVRQTISKEDLAKLVTLLLEQHAWTQETPDRSAKPDESTARLTIIYGDDSITVWEWYKQMEKNQRLIKIKKFIKNIAWPKKAD